MISQELLKISIRDAFTSVMNQEKYREDAIEIVSAKIASAVVDAIKSAQIDYLAGLVSPAGPVTGVFTYTIR